jgi:hypothetical protein
VNILLQLHTHTNTHLTSTTLILPFVCNQSLLSEKVMTQCTSIKIANLLERKLCIVEWFSSGFDGFLIVVDWKRIIIKS